ncbi:hypothetical protein OHA77_32055 [Streptosporangium sp. NBC_01639]|uniref:hypothetical protein n=1 Tax=Streptosporangium sp. NBC_01639 TaxID=2975948 RepID=UPI0038663C53|nr:hypothetical protein OHA77_32055 [Streptosporangium sp. NBC_01639]
MGELNPERLETRYRDWPPRSWYATRRSRRILVGAGACSAGLIWVSAIVCWYLAPSDLAMWTTFALGGSALAIYIVVYSALVGATRGVVGLAEHYLDERQSLERQKVQADARRGTTVILVVLGAVLTFAVSGSEMTIRIPSAAIVMLTYALVTTHLILPSLLMGWRMPDPPPDDEDDRDDEGQDRSGEATGRTGNGQPIDPNTAT